MSSKRVMLNGIVNRVKAVGVELEGGWDAPPPSGAEIIRDGSVVFKMPRPVIEEYTRADGTRDHRAVMPPTPRHPQYAVGEVVSPGKPPRGPLTTEQFPKWVRDSYPQHVNDTCGLHVHMSFWYKLNYSRLMTPDFMPFLIDQLKEWGRREGIPEDHMFWHRLNPDHPWTQQHCAHRYLGDNQVLIKKKDYHSRGTSYSRYTAINYCEAQHSTVEVRVLPMFDTADQAINAIYAVLDATNRFLSRQRQRERAVSSAVLAKPTIFQEFGVTVR